MAKGDDLEDRLIKFAVMVIQLCDRLPPTPAGATLLVNYCAAEPRLPPTIPKDAAPKAATTLFTNFASA